MHDDDADSPRERAAHYRKMALDALLKAEIADEAGREGQREAYLHLAKSWHGLATHLEELAKVPAIYESSATTKDKRIEQH